MPLHLKLDNHSYCLDLRLKELTRMTGSMKTDTWKAGKLIWSFELRRRTRCRGTGGAE